MFQPRAQAGCEQGTDARPGELKLQLVLELSPVTFGGEDRADQRAARALLRGEPVARTDAADERERTQREMPEKHLHGGAITERRRSGRSPSAAPGTTPAPRTERSIGAAGPRDGRLAPERDLA